MEKEAESLEPSKEYMDGVNQGYYIHQYKPELVKSITKSNAHPDYLMGFDDGGMLYERDRIDKELQMQNDELAPKRDKDRGIER